MRGPTTSHTLMTQTTLLALVISMVTGVTLGIAGHQYYGRHGAGALSLDDLTDLNRIVQEIRSTYVDSLDNEFIIEHAIRGIVDGLDAHSTFLDQNAYQSLSEQTVGRFGGIGVELSVVDSRYRVVAPIDGTPAQRAGIRAGDTLLTIDWHPVNRMSLDEVVRLLRGEPGSSVRLGVLRDGVPETLEFELTRATVNVNSVRSRMLEDNIGYVRIAQFQTTTARDLERAVGDLQRENGPLAGLVLDLRDNPGGVLQSSVGASDLFLSEGLIVYTEGRQPSSAVRFSATRRDSLDGAPIAVLINRGSASASEILAGALQDHGRAVIIGDRSFGKGSVQTVVRLSENRALKLTTARYYTPLGRSIDKHGIEPDVIVNVNPDAHSDGDPYLEAALSELRVALAQLRGGKRG
jgi:carboxyl-terminal processing protease